MTARSMDVKIDTNTGLVKPIRGISLNSNPSILERFGGAREVVSIPEELQVIRTSNTHFELVPRTPMSLSRYQELLNRVVLK